MKTLEINECEEEILDTEKMDQMDSFTYLGSIGNEYGGCNSDEKIAIGKVKSGFLLIYFCNRSSDGPVLSSAPIEDTKIGNISPKGHCSAHLHYAIALLLRYSTRSGARGSTACTIYLGTKSSLHY